MRTQDYHFHLKKSCKIFIAWVTIICVSGTLRKTVHWRSDIYCEIYYPSLFYTAKIPFWNSSLKKKYLKFLVLRADIIKIYIYFFRVVFIYGIIGKDDKFPFSTNTKILSFNILNTFSSELDSKTLHQYCEFM